MKYNGRLVYPPTEEEQTNMENQLREEARKKNYKVWAVKFFDTLRKNNKIKLEKERAKVMNKYDEIAQ